MTALKQPSPSAFLLLPCLNALLVFEFSPSAFLLLPLVGPIYKAFGDKLWPLMDELNLTLAA